MLTFHVAFDIIYLAPKRTDTKIGTMKKVENLKKSS